MKPEIFLGDIIDSGLSYLNGLGGPAPSDDARRMLLAIALQESGPGLNARYQNSPLATPGPARGWWQFEQNGGVVGVLTHAASSMMAYGACSTLAVVPESAAVWRALEGHDVLACVFARLLLWTDPRPLPVAETPAWDYYLRNWRPGKPHREAWSANWKTANDAVMKGLVA